MKRLLALLVTLFSVVGVKSQPRSICDTVILYSLIQHHIQTIDKGRKVESYYILLKTNTDTSRFKNFPIILCDSIKTLEPKKIQATKGKCVQEFKYENVTTYCFCSIRTNLTSDLYMLEVNESVGEWGGCTMIFVYKKKKQSWKLVRKSVVSVS